MLFSLVGMLCTFLWHFILAGPSLQLLNFPLNSFLPGQICRCDVNITLLGSNVIVITCTSLNNPSVQRARLSLSLPSTKLRNSENSKKLCLPHL